ncbi:MAG: LytTR family DNA-binding domain-containing protein [Lachnospiraceae bacterium]|nr:LytTR family DNA-binding domain-containing protein [Lachnospiraceae bacterium]
MRVIICEDEAVVAQTIKEKLRDRYQDLDIRIYATGEELIKDFQSDSGERQMSSSASLRNQRTTFSDVILLDVKLPGIDGFSVAKRLRDEKDDSLIIFLTGDEHLVFEAFKVDAFRYLTKPLDEEKLFEAMDAAGKKLRETPLKTDDCIYIQFSGTMTRIHTADIIYAEIYNRKITLHTKNGAYDYYGKMMELQKQVGEDFYSPHRSYLINLNYVEGYTAHEIRLQGGYTAILSKKKYAEFVRTYARFIKRTGV